LRTNWRDEDRELEATIVDLAGPKALVLRVIQMIR